MYLQVLGYEKNQKLMQFSWNYMNDALRTDVFIRYQPETVACACIYLTARKLRLPLPKSPAWYLLFGATEQEIRDICIRVLKLYNRAKPDLDALEAKVEELCQKYRDARAKARGSGNTTPNNEHHRPSSPNQQKISGAHNAWGGFISRSGNHIPISTEKRSRTRSPSRSPSPKHHKRSKKHARSRSRSVSRNHKKSRKRRASYSRSRSSSPKHRSSKKSKEKKRSRSSSKDREVKNDKYIDRYDKYEKSEKYDKDRYKEERYKEERGDRYSEKDRYEEKKERHAHEKNSKKYDREEKYREEKYSSKEEKEKYKKAKYKDEERERSKDRRR